MADIRKLAKTPPRHHADPEKHREQIVDALADLQRRFQRRKLRSAAQALPGGASTTTLAHNRPVGPIDVSLEFECTTPDAGWSIGDKFHFTPEGVHSDDTNFYFLEPLLGVVYINKGTGDAVTLTDGSWQFRFIGDFE